MNYLDNTYVSIEYIQTYMKRIKNNRAIGFFLLLMIAVSGCTDEWFDVKSDKILAVPTTLQDFEYLLNNQEDLNYTGPALGEIASDGHYVPESVWIGLSSTVFNNAQKNAYTWSNDWYYETIRDWENNYKVIFTSNLILDGLTQIDRNLDPVQYDNIKANALFQKAICYFNLSQVFTPPYKKNNDYEHLGLPLKDGINITKLATRSSITETYDEIISLTQQAFELFPAQPTHPTWGSRWACHSLLAKVYLVMHDYDKSGFYANEALEINSALIDFNTVGATISDLRYYNEEIIFYNRMTKAYLLSSYPNYQFVDQDFYDLYEENDLRKSKFFIVTPSGISYKGTYALSLENFTGIATDELYLIRAESNARTNKIPEAMDDVNHLLRNRWKKNPDGSSLYVDQSATDETEALNIILMERKKELLYRGIRWMDLRRLNQDERFKVSLTRTIEGKTYTLEPESYKYTFPIPNDEMSFSAMLQNPGWD